MNRRGFVKNSLITAFGVSILPGSIELEEANMLLKAYAAHFVAQQPLDFRRAWEKQLDQVKLNKLGLYGLTGVDGRVIFEYNSQSKTLNCLSPIHIFRRQVVRPWVFQALQEAADRGLSTNGNEMIYDSVSKGIFVRRTFAQSPVPKKDFIKVCDRVMKTGDIWSKKHFLPALDAFYARNAPPDSATARSGDFRATLVLAEDEAAFKDVWDRPVTAREPAIWTLKQITAGKSVYAFVLFSGCIPKAAIGCSVEASFEILRPDDSSFLKVPAISVWKGQAPPAKHLQMSNQSLEVIIDKKEPPGIYRIRSEVCDKGNNRCVVLELSFQIGTNNPDPK
jgi:hypothetical protein